MPGGDRTGPQGMGPMTGRAAGYCAGYPVAGFTNPSMGMGFGGGFGGGFGRGRGYGGFGGGRGWRNRFYATGLTGWQRAAYAYPVNMGAANAGIPYGNPYQAPYNPPQYTREMEVEGLKSQAEYFEDALMGINKRIEELEKGAKEE